MLKYQKDDPLFQSLRIGNHLFPGIWSYILPQEFTTWDFPEERQTTCMDCPKSCRENYHKDYRCCTYHPRVPNYALGLADLTSMGQTTVPKLYDLGMIGPEGMTHSPQQYISYLQDVDKDLFGKSSTVFCPLLERETGFCTIHRFRNGVCSTFFCIRDHGDVSYKFWNNLQVAVSQIEMALAQWCLNEVGYDVDSYLDRLNKLSKQIKTLSSKSHGGFRKSVADEIWGSGSKNWRKLFYNCAEAISKHRDFLWEIANETVIKDASKYDLAQLKAVPKSLSHQIEEEEWEQGGEAATPEELWRKCRRSYEKIWQLPKEELQLSRKVKLIPNSQADAWQKRHKDRPFYLILQESKKNPAEAHSLFLSSAEAELLQEFVEPQKIDYRFLMNSKCQAVKNPRKFLNELWSHKILTKA